MNDDVLVEEMLFDDEEEEDIKRARNTGPRPGGSNRTGRPDYWGSPWGVMLRERKDELNDPTTDLSKKFRLRFRVPYPIFVRILSWTKEWHEHNSSDAARRMRIPTELKLLGVLRVLGRGTCFDGIEELSSIATNTMSTFFHAFTKWFREVSRGPNLHSKYYLPRPRARAGDLPKSRVPPVHGRGDDAGGGCVRGARTSGGDRINGRGPHCLMHVPPWCKNLATCKEGPSAFMISV